MHTSPPNDKRPWTKIEDGLPIAGIEVEVKYSTPCHSYCTRTLKGSQWYSLGSGPRPSPVAWRYKAPEAEGEVCSACMGSRGFGTSEDTWIKCAPCDGKGRVWVAEVEKPASPAAVSRAHEQDAEIANLTAVHEGWKKEHELIKVHLANAHKETAYWQAEAAKWRAEAERLNASVCAEHDRADRIYTQLVARTGYGMLDPTTEPPFPGAIFPTPESHEQRLALMQAQRDAWQGKAERAAKLRSLFSAVMARKDAEIQKMEVDLAARDFAHSLTTDSLLKVREEAAKLKAEAEGYKSLHASAVDALASIKAIIADPVAVYTNLLRGTIAMPDRLRDIGGDYLKQCRITERLESELETARSKVKCTLGVGDGTGKLFVHGDYDAIKACQAKMLELEALKKSHALAVSQLSEHVAGEGEMDELREARGLISEASKWVAYLDHFAAAKGELFTASCKLEIREILAKLQSFSQPKEGEG